MAYKDKEKAKEKARERMRKMRENKKENINGDNVTPLVVLPVKVLHPDVTPAKSLYWYREGKRVELDKVPAGHKVLSDGQAWKPQRPFIEVQKNPDEYIGVAKFLIDDEKRGKLRAICHALSVKKLGPHLSFGVGGPTMDIVSEMVEMVEAN